MTKQELRKKGINTSKQHIDFMIGTNDLEITAYTEDNKEIKIFEKGKYTKDILR